MRKFGSLTVRLKLRLIDSGHAGCRLPLIPRMGFLRLNLICVAPAGLGLPFTLSVRTVSPGPTQRDLLHIVH